MRWLIAPILLGIVALVLACAGDDPDPTPTPEATPEPTPEVTPSPEPEPHVQAVVSAHELATDAGVEVLEAGGTAADAAIAIAAMLSVVEPWFSSALGGGTWALYYEAETGEVTSLDGVGPTGSNASAADFQARGGQDGMHQSNVPGAWDGWMLWLENYGRLDLGAVLAPAIRVAQDGYPVSAEMADWLGRQSGGVMARPSTAAIYAPGGQLVGEGDIVHQHDLAATFEALAGAYDERLPDGRSEAVQAARDYYYRGPLAEAIVDYSDQFGGYLTLEDFHGFEAQIVEPISIDYNDEITVYQNPPNSQGITMLIALNILKEFGLSGMGPDDPDAVHLQAEALKLAFTDRHYHVGDPARVNVPVDELLSDDHAERQRGRIDMNAVMTWPIADALASAGTAASAVTGTTTFHVVDAEGNAAAVTTSLGAQFYVIGDTGIHINNRMRFHTVEDGDPNQVAPGYKVRHTSNPYMALRDGRPYILGGNTGADSQVQTQVQQFLSLVEFGLTPQEAVERPRFFTNAFPSTTYPYQIENTLEMEPQFPQALMDALRGRGHDVQAGVAIAGNAGMIVLSEDGTAADLGVEVRNGTSSGVVLGR